MSDTTQLLMAGFVTILASGGFATVIVKFMERKKTVADIAVTDAQATDVYLQAGEKAVGILEKQLDRALKRIEHLEQQAIERESEMSEMRKELAALHVELAELRSQ